MIPCRMHFGFAVCNAGTEDVLHKLHALIFISFIPFLMEALERCWSLRHCSMARWFDSCLILHSNPRNTRGAVISYKPGHTGKYRSVVFSQCSQSWGVVRFLEYLHNCLLPPSAMVAVAWWGYPESWHGFSPVALCPKCVEESPWRRLPLFPYHQNCLLCSRWHLLESTHRKKCCSVSYSTSLKASLSLQCTVFAFKCVPSSPPATCGVFRVSTMCYKPTLWKNIRSTTEQQEETRIPDAATEREQANTWSQKP